MNVKWNCVLAGLVVALAGVVSGSAFAAPVPVKVNVAQLRCIQNYDLDIKADDPIYLTVTGVAKGVDVNARVPESGTKPASAKKPPVTDKEPLTLWSGELADGEFALLTVALYQGKGDDAAKAFAGQLADAAKGVAERSKKTLTADEGKKLAADTQKAQQGVIAKVKDTLNREKKTDHFGGLFNVLVWNDGSKLVKRLDPAGLAFGEHYGTDEKIYTKIKYTRNNVLVADADGSFFPQELPPITEDKLTVRVKMLETEFVQDAGKRKKNTTDYLADVQVLAADKPVAWKLGGENIGPTQIHMYWDSAE